MLLSRRRTTLVVVVLITLSLLAHATLFSDTLSAGLPTWASRLVTSAYVKLSAGELPPSAFNFSGPPPNWLAHPAHHLAPMSLKIAFMSHPSEVERRNAIRQLVLRGVPTSEVAFQHQFFVGTTGDADVDARMREEAKVHSDVRILSDVVESRDHLSRKRHAALLWAGEAAKTAEFDYFLTANSDSFIRLAALARRLRGARPDLNPRKQQIVWGHMASERRHWHAGVNDTLNADLDEHFEGEEYPYPTRSMYLLSYYLVKVLHPMSHSFPYRVPFPYDDAAVGSWIFDYGPIAEAHIPFFDASAAARLAPTRDTHNRKITSLTTHLVDDVPGVHSPFGRWDSYFVDWDTMCVQHVDVVKMQGLRNVPQWKDEWTVSASG